MFLLLLIFICASVLLLLWFAASVWGLLLLTQGPVRVFSKLNASSGDNNIKNERVSKYDTSIIPLFMLMFGAYVFLLLLFASAVQE